MSMREHLLSKSLNVFVIALLTSLSWGTYAATQDQTQSSSQSSLPQNGFPPPGEVYKAAMRPLDIVRKSLDNWSDSELAALTIAIHKASDSCGQLKPEHYTGDDLYNLERLCALGQDWRETYTAASRYIQLESSPHRAHSYGMIIDSLVHLNNLDQAVETAGKMLHDLPYDAVVAQSVWYLTTYLEVGFNPQAMLLAKEQHPILIEALSKKAPLAETSGDAVIDPGVLYQEGMQLAFLQRYAKQDDDAAQTVKELKKAIGGSPAFSEDNLQIIEKVDRQYALLGSRLPAIDLTSSLLSPTAKPRMPLSKGSMAAFVLFPEWCAQCVKMMQPLTAFAIRNGNAKINAYGLMVANKIPDSADTQKTDRFKDLKGTPTLLTPEGTFESFGAMEYPFGVVTDRDGIVRFIGALPSNAFDPGGYIEKIIARIPERPVTASNRQP
jgi:thiol-disulfide isomerase/thioredoxin